MADALVIEFDATRLEAALADARSPATLAEAALEGGALAERLVRRNLRDWAMAHANRFGATSSRHFDPAAVYTDGDGASATVHVPIAGIGRARHDVDIRPVGAKTLAFPVSAAVYGMRAASYIESHQADWDAGKIFMHKDDSGDGYIARTAEKGRGKAKKPATELLYILKRHVHQGRDASMLPSDTSLMGEFARGAARCIRRHLESSATL